jgi:hypothetical protein
MQAAARELERAAVERGAEGGAREREPPPPPRMLLQPPHRRRRRRGEESPKRQIQSRHAEMFISCHLRRATLPVGERAAGDEAEVRG